MPVAASTSRRHAAAVLHGEVLGEAAAPGQPEHVDRVVVPEPGQRSGDDRGERRQVVRAPPAAGSRPRRGRRTG